MAEQLWRLDLKRFAADSRLSLAHEEAAGNAREVAEEAVLIEDGFDALLERYSAAWWRAYGSGAWEATDEALREEVRALHRPYLRAAVGEQPEGKGTT